MELLENYPWVEAVDYEVAEMNHLQQPVVDAVRNKDAGDKLEQAVADAVKNKDAGNKPQQVVMDAVEDGTAEKDQMEQAVETWTFEKGGCRWPVETGDCCWSCCRKSVTCR